MAYIYKITNDINEKIYIGKTNFNIEKRFKEHCRDSLKRNNENRPLYKAMNKYGIEHFHIELIEETDNSEEREKYWIEKTGSFKYGYNATKGGDGSSYLDYDLIIKTYNELQNCSEVARILKIHPDTVRDILKLKNIDILSSDKVVKKYYSKIVGMYDKTDQNKLLQIFSSTADAARYLIKNEYTNSDKVYGVSAHISQVCSNKRKTAYGYHWKFI